MSFGTSGWVLIVSTVLLNHAVSLIEAKQNRAASATWARNSLNINTETWCRMGKNRATILHLSRYLWTFDAASTSLENGHYLSWAAPFRVEEMPSTTVGNAFFASKE